MPETKARETNVQVTAVTREDLLKGLQEDLSREYQAIMAYVVYSQALKGAEYMQIAKELEAHAGEELQHAMAISKIIDYLGGMPNATALPVKLTDNAEEMLRADLQNENDTVRAYRDRIRQGDALGEFAMSEQLQPEWPGMLNDRRVSWLDLVGRLRDGTSLQQAQDRVQPADMLGGVVNLQPLSKPPGLLGRKHLVKLRWRMGVQVVHDQHDFLGLRVLLIDYLANQMGEVHRCAPLRDFHPSLSRQRLEDHEQIGCTLAFVLVIDALRLPRRRWDGPAGFCHQLFAGLIQANHRIFRIIGSSVDFQHVFHRTHKFRVVGLGQDPVFSQPGL